MPARHLIVRGRVQGVGFRQATRAEALRLGLRGWVRNRADGSVEAVAEGEEAQLAVLERWMRRGPRAARVEEVRSAELSADDLARVQPPIADDFRQVDTAWS